MVLRHSISYTHTLPQKVFLIMVSTTVQLAQSATGKFQFNAAAGEFTPAALNPHAKEFQFSTLPVQNTAVNFDSFSSDDESPRVDVPPSSKRTAGVRVPPGIKIPTSATKSNSLSKHAKEFVPPKPTKPVGSIRPPPGLEKSLGLSVNASEFVPPPAPVPVWQCAVNLDDYTDDESDDESKHEPVNVSEWHGLCKRLADPSIWSEDKDEETFSESEAETAEPSSHESETEASSGSESP